MQNESEHHITIGIAGHVDHGKTSLVKSLTGIDTDRLKEEKRRGLSIESGIAPFTMENGKGIALVDVPGHTDYLKNTIRGLSAVDAAILVVAADEGCMPQTMEHLDLMELLGVSHGFVVLTKADLVDDETLELAEMEILDETTGSFLENAPVVRFSYIDKRGLKEVHKALEALSGESPSKDPRGPIRMWIDQTRSTPGFGTVVTGTICSGSISVEDTVKVLPAGIQTRVRSLEVHHRRTERAVAGQRVGINLHRISVVDAARGMMLADTGLPPAAPFINSSLTLLPKAFRAVTNRQMVRIHAGTAMAAARVFLMENDTLAPGETSLVQFRMKTPFPAIAGERFIICPLDRHCILGGGKILESTKEKFRASKAHFMLPYLEALKMEDLQGAIERMMTNQRRRPLSTGEISDRTGCTPEEIDHKIRLMIRKGTVVNLGRDRFTGRDAYNGFVLEVLESARSLARDFPLKPHFNAEEINMYLPNQLDTVLLERILEDLNNRGSLVRQSGGYVVPDARGSLSPSQNEIAAAVLKHSSEAGLTPLSVDSIWKLTSKSYQKSEIRKIMNYLTRQNKLCILNDKRFLSPSAIEEIKSRVSSVICSRGAFTIGDCKDTLGYGRTVAIPILEYLDTIGFTRREGDVRVLMERKL